MTKTIFAAHTLPGHHHPALGMLYAVFFTDGTKDFIYAETFFSQDIKGNFFRPQSFVGATVNTKENYYNY
jgi:hypothetical protein